MAPLSDQRAGNRASGFQYAHAPIVEAILDVRATAPNGTTLDDLSRFGASEKGYPTSSAQFEYTNKIEMSPTGVVTGTEHRQTGHVFTSEDGLHLFQARLDGFTFSRLAPYNGWGKFADEAGSLWQRYCEAVRPASVQRVAVRYVNRFEFRDVPVRLDEFFTAYPEMPDELGETTGFIMRVQAPLREHGAALVLTLAQLPGEPGLIAILLDNDVAMEFNLRTTDPSQAAAAVLDRLPKLRTAKNEVFESCITDLAREMIS